MSEEPRPIRTRPRWPWIAGIAAAIVIALVLILALTGGFGSARSDATKTSTPTPRVTVTSTADAAPTGCLGGKTRDAAMLHAAQKAAPHTSSGAVEFAAALVRWTFRSPVASPAEADEVSQFAIASDASASFKDLAAQVASNPNPSGGMVPDGTPWYLSTIPGVWNLESYAGDTATVTIGTAYVVNGALSPTLRASSTFTVKWENGGWHLLSGEYRRTTQELFSIGTPFTGGC